MRNSYAGFIMLAAWGLAWANAGMAASLEGGVGRPERASGWAALSGPVEFPGLTAVSRADREAEAEGILLAGRLDLDQVVYPGQERVDNAGGLEAVGVKSRAAELVAELGKQIRALGNYEVRFAVQTDDGTAEGFYAVGGDRYYMRMGTAEIYSDGAVRYEVNNRLREVTIDVVDAASRNILNNPTRAFDLADDAFVPELLWEREGRAAVRLVPRPGQSALSVVTLTIDTQRMRPLLLEYDFDGDRIRIDILGLQGRTAEPASFDPAAYAGYELIDFR